MVHVYLPPTPSTRGRGVSQVTVAAILGTWRDLLRRRSVLALLMTSVLMTLAIEIPFIVYGAWLETAFGLSLGALGVASVVVGLAEASAELGTTVITDRLGKQQSVLAGLAGLSVSLVLLPVLAQLGLVPALVGVALMLFTFEFSLVSLLPLATEVAPSARASLVSLNITVASLSRVLGSVVGGWLWRWERIALHAGMGASCAVIAALFLAWGMVWVEE